MKDGKAIVLVAVLCLIAWEIAKKKILAAVPETEVAAGARAASVAAYIETAPAGVIPDPSTAIATTEAAGLAVPVEVLSPLIAAGKTPEQIATAYPSLTVPILRSYSYDWTQLSPATIKEIPLYFPKGLPDIRCAQIVATPLDNYGGSYRIDILIKNFGTTTQTKIVGIGQGFDYYTITRGMSRWGDVLGTFTLAPGATKAVSTMYDTMGPGRSAFIVDTQEVDLGSQQGLVPIQWTLSYAEAAYTF